MDVKLVAIYNVWCGDELLKGSIDQIREHVDVVILVYSDLSNTGEHYHPSIEFALEDPNIHLIYYPPVLSISAQANEERKRNLGLEVARLMSCTHFLCMDCDEYYESNVFDRLKNQVINEYYESSACKLYTYYKHPTIQLTPLENYYVPFIHKLYPETRLCFDKGYPAFCDPTRRTNTYKRFLKIGEPYMHHYSFVRKDIERKWRNSSSAHAFPNIPQMKNEFDDFENTGKMVFFKDFGWKEVENQFNIVL